MKSVKSLLALGAGALAIAAPLAQAAVGDTYTSASFGDVTFTFHQDTTTQLTFTISGALTASQDINSTWYQAQKIGAFDLKDLGISNFDTNAKNDIATGPGTGASGIAGLNSQLSASNVDCSTMSPGDGKTICWDIAPDFGPLTNTMTYILTFDTTLAITDPTGPHLQIAFTDKVGCTTKCSDKVGSLYSMNVPQSSTSSSSTNSSGFVPEPNSSALAVLALGLLGAGFWSRRKT
jgi:hypothetical protein